MTYAKAFLWIGSVVMVGAAIAIQYTNPAGPRRLRARRGAWPMSDDWRTLDFEIARGGVALAVTARYRPGSRGNPHAHPDRQEPTEPPDVEILSVHQTYGGGDNLLALMTNGGQYMGDIERYAEQLAAKMNDEEPK